MHSVFTENWEDVKLKHSSRTVFRMVISSQTVMLLSLILADKERQQQDHSGEDSESEDESIANITSAPVPAAEKERGVRGCSGQQQSLHLLPKAAACSQKEGEVAGHSNGNISPSSGSGGQGVENAKNCRQKRELDAASASAFAADPETAGAKRRREAFKIDLVTDPGDSVAGMGEGVAAVSCVGVESIELDASGTTERRCSLDGVPPLAHLSREGLVSLWG